MNTSPLVTRGYLTISGSDARNFLQNLITNDIDQLQSRPYLHASLLTPQGKFLHDFYITTIEDGFCLNCEPASRADDLFKRLTLYKLRANIQIEKQDDKNSYLTSYGYSFDDLKSSLSVEEWELNRFKRARADGSRDADIGISTLDELNLTDTVSFDKGCYLGQELTARMHHRGLGKKHLYAIESDHPLPPKDTELPNKVGIMRSSHGRYGLALIKDDMAQTLPKSSLGFLRLSC